MRVQQSEHPTRASDLATHFVRWSCLRALLHSGYWLVTSLYLVLDAGLSPSQLVLIGVGQGVVSLLCEIPTGVIADTISRKWSLVIFHLLVGTSMVVTGLVTSFPALLGTQMLWGIAWTFASGVDVAWITDELNRPERTAVVLTAQARWQQVGAAGGILGFGALAWATSRSAAMVAAGGMMALLGLYVVVRFTEEHFTPARTQRWQSAIAILRRGVTLARRDREILVVFVATFLVNGAADTFGRLYPKQLVSLGFPDRPDPIVWFTGLGILMFVAGAIALQIVEARIAGAGAARRAYAVGCGIGALGVLLLAAAPDPGSGSAGVLLAAGISWTVLRAVGVIWVNSRTTSDVRATVLSFLAQVEYFGEILCGTTLLLLVQATSITGAFLGASVLTACAGLATWSLVSRD
jgi:MFS family permease